MIETYYRRDERVKVLRELVEELREHRNSWGAFMFGESHVYGEIAEELTKRADKLEEFVWEAGGR